MAILDFFNRKKKLESTEGEAPAEIFAYEVISQKIDEETIRRANKLLQEYKAGKTNLEKRIIENEKWWKLRHWETMRSADDDITPTSAWLFNCLASKHADAMDNYPEINCLPREQNDTAEAKMLSDILPVILEQNDFEETYSDVWWYKLKTGCGVYGIFWDKDKLNGLGDIEVKKIDLLNLFWEPGITDIQKSSNLFHVDLVDNEVLLRAYPQLEGLLSRPTIDVAQYVYDDTVDTSKKSAVVDWYYKRDGVLHYCKYCNNVVLYATENETDPVTDDMGNIIAPAMAETGLYDHGLYPYIFDTLFSEEGTPAGFGYVDICKDPQRYIDYLNQAFLENTLMQSRPRYFSRLDGGINEEEFLDWKKSVVHVNGNLNADDIAPISTQGLSNACLTMLDSKINELKETSGNRDVSNGGTSGATAASAIAAMQEAGSKLSRDMIKNSYRAFKNINLMCIELMRQFYDIPRSFRITGEADAMSFVNYKNSGLQPQAQGVVGQVDMGYRLPVFDIEVSAQKASPYSKMAQNELALQFYQLGFFNPQLSDQALACIDMMDFTGKQAVIQKIQANGTMFEQLQMMQAQMAQMAAALGLNAEGNSSGERGANSSGTDSSGGKAKLSDTDSLKNTESVESGVTANARKRVAESTSPN